MDAKFLELWGNMLINIAKSQQQVEEITRWTQQGVSIFEGQKELLRKHSELKNQPEADPDYLNNLWTRAFTDFQKSFTDFQKSFKEYSNMLGVVPKDEYQALLQKCEALEKKVAEQEETIRQLEMAWDGKWVDQGEAAKGVQDILTKQGEQFSKLMMTLAGSMQKAIPLEKENEK